MKNERKDVDFPLWRKKVDKSLFDQKETAIPMWACKIWEIDHHFSEAISKKDDISKVEITFENKTYPGNVTLQVKGRKTPTFRLRFDENLAFELKKTFLMSHMRSLELGLRGGRDTGIETEIPFWEFLDIEFDTTKRTFKFVSYYKQKPSFPMLFQKLIGSPAIQKLEAEITKDEKPRIFKTDWKQREVLEYEIGAQNVIYMLADTQKKLLYIGEAKDLIKRLSQGYSLIRNWDFFRYDVLPAELIDYRVTLERMLIRSFATLLPNTKSIPSLKDSGYVLVNEKVDK